MNDRSSTAPRRADWFRSLAGQAAIAATLVATGCYHRVAARFGSSHMSSSVAEDELPFTPPLETQHDEPDLAPPQSSPADDGSIVVQPPNPMMDETPANQGASVPPAPTQSGLPPLPDPISPNPRPETPRHSTAGDVPRVAATDRPPVGNQSPPVAQPDIVPPVRGGKTVEPDVVPANVRALDRYVARVGDRFELLFQPVNESASPYRIRRGDQVRVEYLHLTGVAFPWVGVDGANRNAMDRTLAVAPDGSISLPYLGAVPATGKSALELSEILNQRYQQFYVEPQMLVSVVDVVDAAQSLQTSARSAGSRLLLVAPDGSINLPAVGFVRAAGVEIGELERRVVEAYRRADSNLAVSLRLSQSNWPSAESPPRLNGPQAK